MEAQVSEFLLVSPPLDHTHTGHLAALFTERLAT